MLKTYQSIPRETKVFLWKGKPNHTDAEIAELRAVAEAHAVALFFVEGLAQMHGKNGNWTATPGEYIVFCFDGMYYTTNHADLSLGYTSDDPFPAPEVAGE